MIFTIRDDRGRIIGSGENLVTLCREHSLPIKQVCGALLAGKLNEHVHNGMLITASGRG